MIRSMSLLTTELAYALLVLISAMLLARCCSMMLWSKVFNLHNALNDRFAERDVAGITGSICTTLQKTLETYQLDHLVQSPTILELKASTTSGMLIKLWFCALNEAFHC